MEKGRSNCSSTSNRDFSLPRAKILRGRKNFERLFERDARICHKKYIDLRFQIVDHNSFGCLIGFIVKKSLGKANKRNKMKRLLREAYRLHQHILSDALCEAQLTLHGALMAKAIDVSYDKVEHDVIALLKEVRDKLASISSGNS